MKVKKLWCRIFGFRPGQRVRVLNIPSVRELDLTNKLIGKVGRIYKFSPEKEYSCAVRFDDGDVCLFLEEELELVEEKETMSSD